MMRSFGREKFKEVEWGPRKKKAQKKTEVNRNDRFAVRKRGGNCRTRW